jgi:hypothetical protein
MKNFQNKSKIVKVSTILRNISFASLIILGLAIPVSLVTAILPPLFSKQISFSLIQILPIPVFIFSFITNLKIFRFFDRLKNGFFFDAQTVGNLNAAANWWLVLWLYEMVSYVLIQQSWANPNDFSFHHFSPDLGGLFAAMILKFVSWFFREAQGLHEEQELTV